MKPALVVRIQAWNLSCRVLLGAASLAGIVLSTSACEPESIVTQEKKGNPYRIIRIQDPGNHVRKYMALKDELLGIMAHNSHNSSPEEQLRRSDLRDSLLRLPYSPKTQDQLAQLRGFKNARQEQYLSNQLRLERQEIYKTNPSFFTKSRQAQKKWLLLSQASDGSYQGNSDAEAE